MQKTAISRQTIGGVDPTTPFRMYNKYVGTRPALEIPLLTGLGAAGGALGAKQLGYDPRWGAGLLGILALLYGVGKHVDTGAGLSGALQSLLQSDYYKKHPDAARRLQLAGRKRVQYAQPVGGQLPLGRRVLQAAIPTFKAPELVKRIGEAGEPETPALGIQKEQSSKTAFFMGAADELNQQTIPVYYSRLLVEQDPFLAPEAKEVTKGLLSQASGGPVGMVSGRQLLKAAVKAGAGYATAYLFGRGLASVLGADPETSNKVSKLGGIAAAVMNSGILHELGE